MWRFPDKAYINGRAAFLIPHLAASSSLASHASSLRVRWTNTLPWDVALPMLCTGGGVGECSWAPGLVLDTRRGAEGDFPSLREKRVGRWWNCKGPLTSTHQWNTLFTNVRKCWTVNCDGDSKYTLHGKYCKYCHEPWELIATWGALNVVIESFEDISSFREKLPPLKKKKIASWVEEKSYNSVMFFLQSYFLYVRLGEASARQNGWIFQQISLRFFLL